MNSNYRKPRVRVVGLTAILLRGSFGCFQDAGFDMQHP